LAAETIFRRRRPRRKKKLRRQVADGSKGVTYEQLRADCYKACDPSRADRRDRLAVAAPGTSADPVCLEITRGELRMASAKIAITRDPILVDLALQGGGSHGAFTWGVLDRLLEEPWLRIEGISGTSAGAMNAAVLVDGYAKGGAERARVALESFWRRVAEAARFSPFRRGPIDVLLGRWTLDSSPMYVAMDLMSRLLSPYDLNPMGNNPLRAILADMVDFERLAQAPIKLFITATNVRTGRGHVFNNSEVTPDVLLASACLPTMFQAIEINGEPYWDGGYSGNPTMTPLIRECKSQDTILVQINPVERSESPRRASEILNRLNEVSFNAVLLKELRMMALLRQVANPGDSEGAQWAGMRVHRIASEMMTDLGASSKLNAEWEFFSLLHAEGRRSAQMFLETHAVDLGCRSTLDLDSFLQQV
jgi:NTE family protein